MQNVYTVIEHKGDEVPIILSIPHSGTYFPDDIRSELEDKLLPPDDTDWFVDQLYSFATALGITTIKANYSRWLIDLNRNPDNQPLYNDGRWITGLCPATNFLGEVIYKNSRQQVEAEEVDRRKKNYFYPYHQQLQLLLDEERKRFGQVLLWDCHSIRRSVHSISKEPFPDLILGSVDGTSAHINLINKTLEILSSTGLHVSHNHPFKGGFITRHFGRPEIKQYALQLEMCKDLYLDDNQVNYDVQRSTKMQNLLAKTFENLLPLLK